MPNKQSREAQTKVTAHQDKRRGIYVLRWLDSYGDRKQEKTEIALTKANYKKALVAAQEKEADLLSGPSGRFVKWLDFQMDYESQYLASLGPASFQKWKAAAGWLDKIIDPVFVQDLDSRRLSYFYGQMQTQKYGKEDNEKPIAIATINSYMRTILAALSWAAEQQMIPHCPKLRVAKQSKKKAKKMKGRALTLEEYERMLSAAEVVRKKDADQWKYLLKTLWWSGLRLSEALKLSWDWKDPFAVSLDVKYPRYVIDGDAQKSGKSEMLPIAPEYVGMLREFIRSDREGLVLDWPFTLTWTKKVISSIGAEAKVKVNSEGKAASAHDLRRSFGTRWAPKLAPADLKQLMRHATIATTMEFYVDMPADELGSRLWTASAASGACAAQESESRKAKRAAK